MFNILISISMKNRISQNIAMGTEKAPGIVINKNYRKKNDKTRESVPTSILSESTRNGADFRVFTDK